MKLPSWTVSGLRAAGRKGFRDWLEQSGAAVVGLQEVKAREDQLPLELREIPGWHLNVVHGQRAGYSGVALYSRRRPDSVGTLNKPRFDREGRVQLARFGQLLVVNGYFPNGNGPGRDNSRIPYKLAFYRALHTALCPEHKSGGRVLVMGDLNTAHREIDLARPKANRETSGFRPEERAELDRWMKRGWVDTFRHFEPGPGHYSWWSQRLDVRAKNIGWRIDYVLASPGAMPFVQRAFIEKHVTGSDHCPVGVELDPAIVGPTRPGARR